MSKTPHVFQLQGLTLWLLPGTDVSYFWWSVLAPWDLAKCKPFLSFWLYHLIILWSFFSNSFDFLTDFYYFEDVRTIFVVWDWCRCVSLWVQVLRTFLERVTIYFHGLPYELPLMLPYFYGGSVPFPTYYYY